MGKPKRNPDKRINHSSGRIRWLFFVFAPRKRSKKLEFMTQLDNMVNGNKVGNICSNHNVIPFLLASRVLVGARIKNIIKRKTRKENKYFFIIHVMNVRRIL